MAMRLCVKQTGGRILARYVSGPTNVPFRSNEIDPFERERLRIRSQIKTRDSADAMMRSIDKSTNWSIERPARRGESLSEVGASPKG
jgi:hypothetical protein